MNKEDYIATQAQLFALANVVADLPLHDFINAINRAETLGPILDPTLYMNAGSNLDAIGRLADSLLPFHKECNRLKKTAEGARIDALLDLTQCIG